VGERLVEQEEVVGHALTDLLPEAVGTPHATSARKPSTTALHSSTTSSSHSRTAGLSKLRFGIRRQLK